MKIKRIAAKFRLWMLNGRAPVLHTPNYVPNLMQCKLRKASETKI